MRKMLMLATAAVLMTLAGGAFAAEIEVKMLEQGRRGRHGVRAGAGEDRARRHREVRRHRQGPQRRDDQGHAAGGCDAVRGQGRRRTSP